MKKAIKKITAVTTGALLVGSSLLGVAAADLSDFPAPFVTNGVADVQFVIGSGATDDYLGVLDIATTLQASAVSEEIVSAGGSEVTTTVEGGFVIGSDGDPLLLSGNLTGVEDRLTDADLPELLADGELSDDDGDEYDYTQELFIGDAEVTFGTGNSDIEDPTLYLDLQSMNDYAEYLWNYTLDFSGEDANISALDDSETITLLGKAFTVDEDSEADGTITLYGSDTTTLLQLNQPVTVESEGQTYTVEVVGANKEAGDSGNVIIDVNGDRKTVEESFSGKIGGIDIYLEDLFITDIPTLSASANIFIGSNEVQLTNGGTVEIDDESVNGLVSSWSTTTGSGTIDTLTISYNPEELSNDVDGFDETEFLLVGDSVSDPMFGTFSFEFAGGSSDLMAESKSMASLVKNGEDLELTFTGNEGDEVTFTVFSTNGGSNDDLDYEWVIEGDEGYNGIDQTIEKDQLFILNEPNGQERSTFVFEVESFTVDNGEDQVTIKNLNDGTSKEYEEGDEFENTNVFISHIIDANESLILSAPSNDTVYVEGGYHTLTINAPDTSNELGNIVFAEQNGGTDDASEATVSFRFSVDTDDDEIDVATNATTGTILAGTSDDNDNRHHLTEFGTFIDLELDESDYAELYIPKDEDAEVTYEALIKPEGAIVTVTGGSDSVSTQKVNPVGLGIAVRDIDVNVAAPAKNLIVVGGTCINSVAATLKGVAAGTCGAESGLNPDEAIIELFDLDNGKVAMLIAGWEATETQAAARAVASQDASLTGESATLTVTSATNYQIQ